MPWLTSTDELPRHPCRVLIAGSTGAGKSTLARAVARQLKIDYFEIDALYHGPDWIPQPSFESSVDARIATSAWVTEWQYSSVQSRLADRADLMVWLDLPRQTVMRSVIRRTIRRSLSGAQLWNGNQEPALRTILTDHDHIIRWRGAPITPAASRSGRASKPALTWTPWRCAAEKTQRHG
jgi:energy-coupling factor transporter ATP-binding protein EcfA2